MSDWRKVDDHWMNFSLIDQIYIKCIENEETEQDQFFIYAITVNQMDNYEEDFPLFDQSFDDQDKAQEFIDEFMNKNNKG